MDKNKFTVEQLQEMETASYNVFDLLVILKDYCSKNKESNPQLQVIDKLIDQVADEFEKIVQKF